MPFKIGKKTRFLLNCLLVFLLYHLLASFCKTCTDGFSVTRILSDLPFDAKWQTAPPSSERQKEIDQILSQPFSYLGRGGQAFVFASNDGKYVVKFFKHCFYKSYEFFLSLPLPSFLGQAREKNRRRLLEKIDEDCFSHKTALEELPQEVTGLLYLHLCPKEGFERSLTVTDKLGISHSIPLNKTAFLIQRKGEVLSSYLAQTKGKEEAKEAIRSVLGLLALCAKKGIFHTDPGFDHNIGLINERPFLLDLGNFVKQECSQEVFREKLKRGTGNLRLFLEKNHPELVSILEEELNAL